MSRCTPESIRTRKDSILSTEAKKQLLVDLESGEGKTPSEIVKSRPKLYGGSSDSKLQKAAYDKLRVYLKLKKSSPKEYW